MLGSGVTRNMRADATTTTPVWTASQNVRRPERSARWPVSGASRAMSRPAAASAHPSLVSTPEPKSGSPASSSAVRYTVKTKVVITALKAADPQSHRPQAATGQRRPA
ncbi:hypothetical protein QE366_003438 [Nocardioides zeae]|nr:hypothetical protein [Nocardioides zeae]